MHSAAMAGGTGTRHLLVPEGQHFFNGARTWNCHGLQAQQPKQVRCQLRVEPALPARGPNRRHTTPESDLCVCLSRALRLQRQATGKVRAHEPALAGESRTPSPVRLEHMVGRLQPSR
eukprot:3640422-Rhodomonas_salina.1